MLRAHARTLIAYYKRPIDPDELVQITLQHAWRNIQSFEYAGEGSFRHWLQRLARNLYLSELKQAAARPQQEAESGIIANTADEKAAALERNRAESLSLDEALGALADEDREILLMVSDEKLSLNQMAEILGCCHETAKRRLMDAQDRLRRRLTGRGDPP